MVERSTRIYAEKDSWRPKNTAEKWDALQKKSSNVFASNVRCMYIAAGKSRPKNSGGEVNARE